MSEVVRVCELAEQLRGVTYGKSDASSTSRPGYLPVLRAGNITEGGLTFGDLVFVPAERISAKQKIRRNDVVIAASSGSLDVVGKAARALHDYEGGFGAFCKVLRPGPDVDPAYFAHFFRTQQYRQRVSALAAGVNINNLRNEHLDEIQIPIPTLREQKRIARILDKADTLRAKRRAALAQLDTLTQSTFNDMFGDPATNPKGWPVKRIDEITECLDRLRRPVTVTDRKPGSVPYYGANGQQGWIDVPLFDEPLVLVAEDGGYFDAPQRGVAYRIDGPAWVNNHAHILRAIPEHVDTEFLHRSLRHYNFLPYISGTTRAKLTQGQLNSVKLFVPPPELQQDFSKRIGDVQRIARCTSASSDQLDALFACLQHRAFRGEL